MKQIRKEVHFMRHMIKSLWKDTTERIVCILIAQFLFSSIILMVGSNFTSGEKIFGAVMFLGTMIVTVFKIVTFRRKNL